MPCYHPQVVYVFKDKKSMSNGHTLVQSDFDYRKLKEIKLALGNERSFYNKKLKTIEECICTDATLIPCGHCVGCSTDISKSWMNRMVLEKEVSSTSYFLTITYDEEHLPSDHMLKKNHLDKFIKDIRNYFKNNYDYDNIRYYACGEYGSKTARPHYHMIVYNLPLTSLEYEILGLGKGVKCLFKTVGMSVDNEPLYQFDFLNNIWKKGFVVVGKVTSKSCGYVARYVNKKRMKKLPNWLLEKQGIVPEFNCMSRMPGIGEEYYHQNYLKILDNNLNFYIDGQLMSVGRYFEKFLDKFHPEEMERYKKLKESKSLFGKAYISGLSIRSPSTTINEELEKDEALHLQKYSTLHRK